MDRGGGACLGVVCVQGVHGVSERVRLGPVGLTGAASVPSIQPTIQS